MRWNSSKLAALGAATTLLLSGALPTGAAAQEAGPCGYRMGFAKFASAMPEMVGTCTENEYFNTLNGNAQLGATYIEWLTMYFGLYYFGSYDLMNATAPIQTGGGTLSLLDVVIAAYNVGPAAVENDNGTPNDGSDDTLSIPNTSYVNMVHTAYANQPWT